MRPGGLELRLELPTFWFVAIRVKMLNALFGVAYGLETPFFPQLAAPNVAPKTELYRTCTNPFMSSIRKAEFRLGERILNHRPRMDKKTRPIIVVALGQNALPCLSR